VSPARCAQHGRADAEVALARLAAAAIIGIGFNGASFLNYNHPISSLIMTGCALLAIVAYMLILRNERA
jgi:hypothetical protein